MIIAFFLLLFVVMMPTSIYLLVKQRENRLLFWGALIILTVGLSGLQVGLEKLALPLMESSGAGDPWINAIYIVTAFLNIIIHAFPYYLILVFFMYFSGYSTALATGLLLVPALLTFVFSDVYPAARMNYSYILSWAIPYMLVSAALFAIGLLKVENIKHKRLQYFGIGMIVLIPEVFLLLLQLEGIYFELPIAILTFIPILCLISLLLGLIFYVYNVFARFQSATVLTKMQIGTSMMQHAFKNAISKNKLHALNMQRSLEAQQYEAAGNHLNNLLNSNDHLMSMVSKLSYLTRSRISLELETLDISGLLREVLDQWTTPAVAIETRFTPAIMELDRTLVAECFSNVISNAVEAMEGKGTLTVTVERIKHKVKVSFSDTGKGMDKEQVKRMFEPFFSTKHKSGHNFGLGMFYVRKIMSAHRGKVAVASQLGKGTTVTLYFS